LSAQKTRPVWALVGGIAASTVFVGLVVAALIHFDLGETVVQFLRELEQMGIWAGVIFVAVLAVVVVLLLPGVLLTTGAGFVFGVVEGTVAVVVGTTLGAALAFLIARFSFGKRAQQYLLNNPKLRSIDSELPPHAWKIVLVSRLIPFFPSKLANYFFGLTSVSFRAFTLGSLVGFIPLSLHNVYLGAIAAELTTQGLRTADFGDKEWVIYIGGFVLVAAAVVYLGSWGWRTMRNHKTPDPSAAGTG
jgi:uncharacterized membrane protein YdjX (TVP38/TMEM64 family)